MAEIAACETDGLEVVPPDANNEGGKGEEVGRCEGWGEGEGQETGEDSGKGSASPHGDGEQSGPDGSGGSSACEGPGNPEDHLVEAVPEPTRVVRFTRLDGSSFARRMPRSSCVWDMQYAAAAKSGIPKAQQLLVLGTRELKNKWEQPLLALADGEVLHVNLVKTPRRSMPYRVGRVPTPDYAEEEGEEGIDLVVAVISLGDGTKLRPELCASGSREIVVGDETGAVTVVLPPSALEGVAVGDVLEISNTVVTMDAFLDGYFVSLRMDAESAVKRRPGPPPFHPYTGFNLSDMEFERCP
uniref:Ubiquitin-like domain-containing protein n=1 Tax=Alexandrium monilatum TaxID=311494 RepID=A0A7S4UZT8_9DINO|mmetsp:Transcript_101388/g.322088  ORF Transcript_101388/g.322088 Transcript_101388/m.322088 type:complete len:299 (+) Transcript_101388:73-969(+)